MATDNSYYKSQFKLSVKKELKNKYIPQAMANLTQQIIYNRDLWNYLRYSYLLDSILNADKYNYSFDIRLFMTDKDKLALSKKKQITFADIELALRNYIYPRLDVNHDLIKGYYDEWRLFILRYPDSDKIAEQLFTRYESLLKAKSNPTFLQFINEESMYDEVVSEVIPELIVREMNLSKNIEKYVGLELRLYHRNQNNTLLKEAGRGAANLPHGKHNAITRQQLRAMETAKGKQQVINLNDKIKQQKIK